MAASKQNQHEERLMYGALLTTLSMFFLSFMGLFSKLSNPYISTGMVIFFQCLVAFILILPIVYQQKTPLKTNKLFWHFVRAICGTGAWYCLYVSIHLTSLTVGSLLLYSSPLLVPLVSHFILRQKVKAGVWFAVFLGFVGIVLVLNPMHSGGKAILNIGVLYGVVSAILMTVTQFSMRKLRETENTLTILFYYLLISTIVFMPGALLTWTNPPLFAWGLVFIMGILMIGSNLFITHAYRFASPVHLGAFIYGAIIFSALLDCIFLHAKLDYLAWLGMFLVICGGVLIIRLGQKKS